MAIFHNLHYYFLVQVTTNPSPGLLQVVSFPCTLIHPQQSMCHTAVKFFLLILGRIVSFICSKYSKVFHPILSENQNSYTGLYNPWWILQPKLSLRPMPSIPPRLHTLQGPATRALGSQALLDHYHYFIIIEILD